MSDPVKTLLRSIAFGFAFVGAFGIIIYNSLLTTLVFAAISVSILLATNFIDAYLEDKNRWNK